MQTRQFDSTSQQPIQEHIMATTHTEFGKFINHYRALERAGILPKTPVILSEGDSWFSTPLYYNLVDWLEVESSHALFMRMENSGDLAINIFQGGNLRTITSRLKAFEFDVLLLSAGGNDFVAEYLRDTFRNAKVMSPQDALQKVIDTGRYEEVLRAYRRVLDAAFKARPGLKIITHTYDYPRVMGQPAELTVEQLGLAAIFKRSIGDWIAKHVKKALPTDPEQREFARLMIDTFSSRVLAPLKDQYQDGLTIVEFREQLTPEEWNDEMHPSEEGFKKLAVSLREAVGEALPFGKRGGHVR